MPDSGVGTRRILLWQAPVLKPWVRARQVVEALLRSVSEQGGYAEADFTQRLDALLHTLDGTAYGAQGALAGLAETSHGAACNSVPGTASRLQSGMASGVCTLQHGCASREGAWASLQ
jgi:hypothetical protein